jgi:TolB-like protein/predicted Zn-dependent protease
MTEPSHAVFLSYASQDAEAAQKICEALRAAGIDVWLDQSELRGGDAWDRQIRERIHDCRLFIAVISAHTEARSEGYFRREWKLAVDRTHDMSERLAFIVPVVIDGTADAKADVPDAFRSVQWTRLLAGETRPAFVERVQRLLSPEASTTTRLAASAGPRPAITEQAPASWWLKRALPVVVAVVILAASAYFAADKLRISKPAASTAVAPPPHSVAVLPFVNMSGDKGQEYFSEGLTEELLNSLSRINQLQVAARTSSFSFQGEHPDIATVAHKLNVGAVLEGSVRRSGNTVRVTAQLINGVTGFHLWSETYDRDLGDVLKLQTEIATAVASALRVTLLGDVASKIEVGGTSNPAALDAYLHGSSAYIARHNMEDVKTAVSAYTEAIRLQPDYARAFAARAAALNVYGSASEAREAVADALKAISLAPELGEAHLALADAYAEGLDFSRANEEYERAFALAPGNAQVLQSYGDFAVAMGHFDVGLAAARRAVLLDPLNRSSHYALGSALRHARRYKEAIESTRNALALDPELTIDPVQGYMWMDYYELGDLQRARESCNAKRDNWLTQLCLAVIYDKLGQHADAEAELAKLRGDDGLAYQWAEIYAQWGNSAKALDALDVALRLRDPGLQFLKVDSLLDPLRHEPRFQAVERALKFPN